MMGKVCRYLSLSTLLVCLMQSCADEQDFDQFDDLSVTPELASSLFYFESPETLINSAGNAVFYSQEFNFDAFEEGYVADNIMDGVITYEIENTTSKPLDILIEFLDETGNSLDSESFQIDPEPTAILLREVAYGTDGKSLDILRNTSSIRISGINLGDSTSVSTQSEPKIIIRSSAAFAFRLQ
ncbi:MAG: hypothetical protein AAGB24_08905 [Bacteroidota bacterium]